MSEEEEEEVVDPKVEQDEKCAKTKSCAALLVNVPRSTTDFFWCTFVAGMQNAAEIEKVSHLLAYVHRWRTKSARSASRPRERASAVASTVRIFGERPNARGPPPKKDSPHERDAHSSLPQSPSLLCPSQWTTLRALIHARRTRSFPSSNELH